MEEPEVGAEEEVLRFSSLLSRYFVRSSFIRSLPGHVDIEVERVTDPLSHVGVKPVCYTFVLVWKSVAIQDFGE